MKLYDSMIEELSSLLPLEPDFSYPYDEKNTWRENHDYEMILQKDSAYELGGSGLASANYTLVTTGKVYVPKDEILVYGSQLQDICNDVPYARIVIVRVKDNEIWNSDSDKLYQMLSDIDFVKYHIFTKGYMIRNSAKTYREQVRVSRRELQRGMTFEKIGNSIISHYRNNQEVEAVKLIFVTGNQADYKGMLRSAKKSSDIRKSLSVINKNLPTECSICGIRDICNEVEGLKELHFGKKSEKNISQLII